MQKSKRFAIHHQVQERRRFLILGKNFPGCKNELPRSARHAKRKRKKNLPSFLVRQLWTLFTLKLAITPGQTAGQYLSDRSDVIDEALELTMLQSLEDRVPNSDEELDISLVTAAMSRAKEGAAAAT